MGLSRLEKYLAIIKVLDSWDSLTQKQIMQKADLNLVSIAEDLAVLVNLDLISEKTLGNSTTYSVMDKGQRVSNYFRLMEDNSIFAGTQIVRID